MQLPLLLGGQPLGPAPAGGVGVPVWGIQQDSLVAQLAQQGILRLAATHLLAQEAQHKLL